MNNAEYINEKLPDGWDEIPAKFLVSTPIKTGAGAEALEYDKDKIRYIRITDFDKNGNIDESKKASLPKEEGLKNLLNNGDVLAATAGATVGKSMLFTGLNEPCAYAGYLARFDTDRKKLNNKFLLYYLQSPILDSFKAVAIAQSTIENISASKYANMKIIVPPIDKQNRIVEFLDNECKKIDKYKLNHNLIIEKLEEYRKSIIAKAVTSGVNKDVPTKKSEIDYVERVPKHWKLNRLKFAVNYIGKGAGITKEDIIENGDINCVRYGEIYSKYNNTFENCFSKTNLDLVASPQYFEYGDILFAGTGELIEEIGKNIVYLGNDKCLAGGDIIVLKHKQNPKYLNYLLNSVPVQAQKSCGKSKLKVVHISGSEIGDIKIYLPDITEQKQIADYLDIKYSIIDELIIKQNKSIEKLEEYKKSLIYNVITGKMEVK